MCRRRRAGTDAQHGFFNKKINILCKYLCFFFLQITLPKLSDFINWDFSNPRRGRAGSDAQHGGVHTGVRGIHRRHPQAAEGGTPGFFFFSKV